MTREDKPRLSREMFILRFGLVRWGLPVGLIVALFMSFTSPRPLTWTIPASLIIFGIAGIIYGAALWSKSEKAYQEVFPPEAEGGPEE